MTIQEYKQQLYDACREHNELAQQALDRYATVKTNQERERARLDNIQHLAACNALQWALDMTIDFEQQVKQAKIDVLNELKTHSYYDDDYMEGYVFVSDIDERIEEIEK